MSIIADHIRLLDIQLDHIPIGPYFTLNGLPLEEHQDAVDVLSTARVQELQTIVKSLSTTSSQVILSPAKIQSLLKQSGLANTHSVHEPTGVQALNEYEEEMEWLIVAKAAIQVHGVIMNMLVQQMIPMSDHIWYWDEVLGSYTASSLYTVQTAPSRFWDWALRIYEDSSKRLVDLYDDTVDMFDGESESNHGSTSLQELGDAETLVGEDPNHPFLEGQQPHAIFQVQGDAPGHRTRRHQEPAPPRRMAERWLQFYQVVRESIQEDAIYDFRQRIMSPVALCRTQATTKRDVLKKLRHMTASGLGVLMGEGFCFGDGESPREGDGESGEEEWKSVIEKSVALIDMVLKEVVLLDNTVAEMEDRVFAGVESDPPEGTVHSEETENMDRTAVLARRLQLILGQFLESHGSKMRSIIKKNGRPSWLVRYWLPAGLMLFSSTAIVRYMFNRKDNIVNWIRDVGSTVRSFWLNWVIDPVVKVVSTIRHDVNSEIAINRESLKADRQSLERMVVEFATDRPGAAVGHTSISDVQLEVIRAKVQQGDVTPVLKAYEQDLRNPFVGAMKGDLVRSLLIQVQKTKVDLEVALDGIDALLKSQELVFGFVGLTPGVLVSVGVWQYLRGVFGGRKGLNRSHRAGRCVRVLRNIDRIFAEATPGENNLLVYKDHGLLLCEVHVLRQLVHGLFPGDIEKEFLEDIEDMANMRGIPIQVKASERIRWAYSAWLLKS